MADADSNNDALMEALRQALKRLSDTRSSWAYCKRAHRKAWSATDESWPDEASRKRVNEWENQAYQEVLKADERVEEARSDLRELLREHWPEATPQDFPEDVRETLEREFRNGWMG